MMMRIFDIVSKNELYKAIHNPIRKSILSALKTNKLIPCGQWSEFDHNLVYLTFYTVPTLKLYTAQLA